MFDSVSRGFWLPEEPYEVALSQGPPGPPGPQGPQAAFNPVRQWRERVAEGRLPGAFHDWKVLLVVEDPLSKSMFKRWVTQKHVFRM